MDSCKSAKSLHLILSIFSFTFYAGTNFEIPRATAEALHPLAQVPGVATPMDQAAVGGGDPSVTLQASLALAQQQAQQAAIISQQTAAAATAATAVSAALGATAAAAGTMAAGAATAGATQSTTPCFMLSNMFDPTR